MTTNQKQKFLALSQNSKDLVLISVIYTLAHGLILFNTGLYWDDWTYYFVDRNILIDTYSQYGMTYVGYIYAFLLSFPHSITLFRAIVFLAFLLAALLLYSVLKSIKEIDRTSRFILVVLFAVFPVYSARLILVCLFGAIVYFIFFLSLWLTSKYLAKKNPLLRVLALAGFFASFTVNSLLFFYVLVILYIVYKENCLSRFPPEIHRVLAVLLRYIDFVALPLFFWGVRSLFFTPHGGFEHYNDITLGTLAMIPFYLVYSFYSSFVQVLARPTILLLSTPPLYILSTIILAIICLIALCVIIEAMPLSRSRFSQIVQIGLKYQKAISRHLTQWYRPAETQTERTALKLFIAGLLFFGVGVFPYLAVSKMPELSDWNSRHQLLVPLGASFMLFYGFKIASDRIIKSSFVKVFLISVIIALFVMCNVVNYLDYQRDWYKEVSLIDNFKKSEEIKNHTTFLFDDKTSSLNANNRVYRFTEYSTMLQYGSGEQSRFGSDVSSFNSSRTVVQEYYNSGSLAYLGLKDYKPTEPDYTVIVGYGSYPMTYVDTIKLMYYEKFNTDKFSSTVDNIVTLKLVKFTGYG
jgi:hypothetical protein